MPKKPQIPLAFETSLKELETLVERMEKGELSLEDALRDFERGIELTRSCQKALREAEQKVQILIEKDGQATLEAFADATDEAVRANQEI